MSGAIVFAVDGGNSKTDLALVRDDGAVLSLVRGPLSSPHHLGLDGSLAVLGELWERATTEAALSRTNGPIAAVGRLCMAGVDFPVEEQVLQARIAALGWAKHTSVANDTYAVLRAGTDDGWGVGLVCGAGINCVAVARDGREVRFPALGEITGDWGGGRDVGMSALAAAARSADGRGPRTSLEHTVPQFFGLETPDQVAEAIHVGRLESRRVIELPPLVFAEAEHDLVAASIVERLTFEIVALVRASLMRLDLTQEHVQVALGGGVARALDVRVIAKIRAELHEVGPHIELRLTSSPPVLGAALSALDELGVGPDAHARVRTELATAGRTDG
jgi:N-acetylglucosamine kinase-like BadF-type ATPase